MSQNETPVQYFTADDGAKIAYRDNGAGQPLLCLSGLTRNSTDFDYLAAALDDVRLIRIDYRGRGKSDWTGADTYTVPREAADVIGLLQHLGLKNVPILGTSRGGIIGQFMAAKTPDLVAGLCMNDIGPELELAGRQRITTYVGVNPDADTIESAAQSPTLTHGFANVPDGRWLEEAHKLYLATPSGLTINYDPALRDSYMAAFNKGIAPNMWAAFQTLADKPVAVIRGANSDVLSPEIVARMIKMHPDMIFAQVPDRAHMPFLDEPESLAAIQTFLQQIQALQNQPAGTPSSPLEHN
ncbi:MAG: alpha/beta hydrolase [Marinosulfonomonas sp.]|nr:alpha/beta hydrolase [Marinosulfonomonas sp.]